MEGLQQTLMQCYVDRIRGTQFKPHSIVALPIGDIEIPPGPRVDCGWIHEMNRQFRHWFTELNQCGTHQNNLSQVLFPIIRRANHSWFFVEVRFNGSDCSAGIAYFHSDDSFPSKFLADKGQALGDIARALLGRKHLMHLAVPRLINDCVKTDLSDETGILAAMTIWKRQVFGYEDNRIN